MISDADIESVAVSAASAQQAADNLVASALTAGGSDNVTVIVVDVLNDGVAAKLAPTCASARPSSAACSRPGGRGGRWARVLHPPVVPCMTGTPWSSTRE